MNEQRRHPQLRQMLDPKLLRLARRMQWIRKQQQARRKTALLGAQHRRLAPAVGVPAEKDSSAAQLPHRGHCIPQPLTIAPSVPRPGRTERRVWRNGRS